MTKAKDIVQKQGDNSDAFTISMATHVVILHVGSVHVGSAIKVMREFDEF